MNKHFFLFLLSFPLFVTAQDRLVINNVSVLDMTDSIVKPGKTVIIEGNKISFIGKNSKIPVRATIIDGAGKFLIPGLWDMHVHTCHERWEKSIPTIEAREVFLNSFIPNGITGIRDMGGDQKQIKIWKEQIRQGKRIGPLIVAGPIVDGPEKLREDYISISTPEEAVQTVKTLQNDGVDFIKVYTTLHRDVYFALAKECNSRHIDFRCKDRFYFHGNHQTDYRQKEFHLLPLYSVALLKESISDFEKTQQKNLMSFMKTLLIKRLESSFFAFNQTLDRFISSYEAFLKAYYKGFVYLSRKHFYKVLEYLMDENYEAIELLIENDKAESFKASDFRPEFKKDLETDCKTLKHIKSLWEKVKRPEAR
jgi:hypothetical protein